MIEIQEASRGVLKKMQQLTDETAAMPCNTKEEEDVLKKRLLQAIEHRPSLQTSIRDIMNEHIEQYCRFQYQRGVYIQEGKTMMNRLSTMVEMRESRRNTAFFYTDFTYDGKDVGVDVSHTHTGSHKNKSSIEKYWTEQAQQETERIEEIKHMYATFAQPWTFEYETYNQIDFHSFHIHMTINEERVLIKLINAHTPDLHQLDVYIKKFRNRLFSHHSMEQALYTYITEQTPVRMELLYQ